MAGIDAFGTQFLIDSGSGYTAVAELTNIDVLDVSVDDLETTSHDSPGGWKEFIGGLKDGGALSMELNFDPDQHASVLALAGDTHDMRILFPNGDDQVDFSGYVNAFTAGAPHDDKLTGSITVKVSGQPVVTNT